MKSNIRTGGEAGLEVGFGGGPVFAGDAEPDAVAEGAVGHEVVVAEGAFVDGADGLHGVLRLQVFVVGLESYAVEVEGFEGVGELEELGFGVDEGSARGRG
jgi:hypothetical protein